MSWWVLAWALGDTITTKYRVVESDLFEVKYTVFYKNSNNSNLSLVVLSSKMPKMTLKYSWVIHTDLLPLTKGLFAKNKSQNIRFSTFFLQIKKRISLTVRIWLNFLVIFLSTWFLKKRCYRFSVGIHNPPLILDLKNIQHNGLIIL